MQEQRNPFFTGREGILANIASFFADDHLNIPIALCGLGGIGKTQIALEYAYRHQQEYQTVMWLNASSRGMLSRDIGALADQHLTGAERMNEPQLFAAFKHWLQNADHWLLVLDHIEDLSLIEEVVPTQRKPGMHILLTTRQQIPESLAHVLMIPMMDTVEGALLVLRRSGQIPPDASPEELNRWNMLLHRDPSPPTSETEANQQDSPALAFDQITSLKIVPLEEDIKQTLQRLSLPTLAILRLLSFFSPDFLLPEHLLLDGASVLSKPLRSLTNLNLDHLLTELVGASLVDWSEGMLHLPPIVQTAVIQSLTAKHHRSFARQVVRFANYIFPEVRFDTRAECERYILLAQHCATLINKYQLTVKEGGLLLERLGNYFRSQAVYDKAEIYLTQARDLYQHHLSTKVLDKAQELETLGLLYNDLARFQEAEECHLQALELREQALGPDDPKSAQSLHNLALTYAERGKYQEAERIYLRVLSVDDEDADVATTLNNLGATYSDMGRYAEAEEYYQRALSLYEQELGPDHPNVAVPLNGLGALAEEQEEYPQAEALYQRALMIREHTLSPQHPDIAYSLNHLADVYESQGLYQQAGEYYQRALTIVKQVLKPDHPDIALLFNNLAFLANKLGQYQEAEALYQKALSIYEHALGAQHPNVAGVLHNLGRLYHNVGDDERAEAFLRRALALREQQLGLDHPDVAQSLSALGGLFTDQQRDAEAEPMLQRALVLYLKIFSPEHRDVVQVREKYATLRSWRGPHEG